jgi:hypothetical protein
MIETTFLAVPPLLELVELPELTHPLARSATAPAVATAFVRVILRMSSLLIVETAGGINAGPGARRGKGTTYSIEQM